MPGHNPQKRSEKFVQAPLASGAGYTQHQNHAGHGNSELQNAGDGREGDVGLSAGLQSDSLGHGAVRIGGRRAATVTELQALPAALAGLERDINASG